MPKQLVRKKLLQQRRQCAKALCRTLSREIQDRFLATAAFADAECLALYASVHNEVGTDAVAEAVLAAGKQLAYPRVENEQLSFIRTAGPEFLAPGFFNVPEPVTGEVLPAEAIDVCVVPGVAFDFSGHRLGYGRGYYDRFLARCPERTQRIGFAYEFQLVDALPAQAHDQLVNHVITEKRILDFPRRQEAVPTAQQ